MDLLKGIFVYNIDDLQQAVSTKVADRIPTYQVP